MRPAATVKTLKIDGRDVTGRQEESILDVARQNAIFIPRLCEMDGARWVYDPDELGAIRRDVMTILTHHAASRQAAMAPYGRLLLAHGAG